MVILKSFWILLFFAFSVNCQQYDSRQIREAVVAGTFYPSNPSELTATIDALLDGVKEKRISESIIAMVAPHAGYIYSGHVAAEAYAQLKDRGIERVVVISPSHTVAFDGISAFGGTGYATPLGEVEIDKHFIKKLVEKSEKLSVSNRGHVPESGRRGEHALEVHLPFLQRVLGKFKLVPLVMGDQQYQTCRDLGRALSDLIEDHRTIIIASSDLSHFHPYTEAMRLDKKVLRSVEEWDHFNLSRNLNSRRWEACGGGPVVAAMIASEQLGANQAHLLKYANSGDISQGDKKSVVGYASFSFVKSEEELKVSKREFKLDEHDQEILLQSARSAVETKIKSGDVYDVSTFSSSTLLVDRGAFVTLKIDHRLRGCIGYTAPVKPLIETVRDVAIQAATSDPRFPAVSTGELEHLDYEISVLSPFRLVLDPDRIEVGKHGLLIQRGKRAGLLLPQVPVEQNWDRVTFIEQTCRKAGLPADAWEDEDTDIFQFSAFVFHEKK